MGQKQEAFDFAKVSQDEAAWLAARRQAAGVDANQPRVGLAFSGGGIRSACFQLGLMQGLIHRDRLRQVDYLSSVSGGGYLAGGYQWLKRQQKDDHRLFDAGVLNWLRGHASYLTAGKGVGGATLGAAMLASSLFSLLVLLPMLLFFLWAAGLPHSKLPWPAWLHMPETGAIHGHAGYLLMLMAAAACFAFYLLSIPTMALWRAGRRGDLSHIFKPRLFMGKLLKWALVLALAGGLPLVAQFDDSLVALVGSETLGQLSGHFNYLLPFATGAWAMTRAAMKPKLALFGLAMLLFGMAAFAYHLVFHAGITHHLWYWGWLALAVMLASLASVNRTSMHSYYLAQLAQAFFYTGKPQIKDMPLSELTPGNGAPLPLFNTTLATANSRRPLAHARKGDSFTLSPLYCGNPATGYAQTAQFQAGRLSLGEAVTTSGAAVDPDQAQTANKGLSFLMTLLNFRLGFWVHHPRRAGVRFGHMPFWLIFKELLGRGLHEHAANLHLSDGGHFENLGIYELLRRECDVIIASDAGADPDARLLSLGLLLQRTEADFGCHINLDPRPLTTVEDGVHQSSHALGEIRYASGKRGRLLFIKALLTPQSSAQVSCFAKQDPSFPNDSTADQFFDERHLDAYRELGRENLLRALKALDESTVPAPTQQEPALV
ncbi:hypothetical protein PVT67_16825 [Gallaecimonas kandeliae]|uniref:hypothetical protein n=1 Tax=Gallaecimonas kandeliae TaxID=3029055 RepID=UPI002647191A|nr:hypothetical protein [Gallaecimonas kandeliae]WKE65307.1 hypothetical protein PVT67_16825 [Gallaecimonas kandeliae]